MSRLPVEKLSVYLLLALIGLLMADLGLLFVRGGMYPQQPPPATPIRPAMTTPAGGGGNLAIIRDRNIFNSDGKIAAALGDKGGEPQQETDPDPVPSTLPITLLGTIVHANPARSVASVTVKAKSDPIAVKVGDMIPDNMATMILVERSKITFRNKANNRREYIELKDDSKISLSQAAPKPVQQGEVLKKSENDFELKRDDINRLTNNLPELLQQARAVPRMGPGGMIECFSLADISAGSIYERLGLKRGDCIKSVNGEKIDSPAKAMELYNALRSSADTINLGVERNGKDDNFQYSITK